MIELVYYSEANHDLSAVDISNILKTARDFNHENQITGCLLYNNNEFLQILEGEKKVVMDLFESIKKDKRHSNVMLLALDYKNDKMFDEWSMAYHEIDGSEQDKKIFSDNIVAFSEIADKPTQVIDLFWAMAKHIALN